MRSDVCRICNIPLSGTYLIREMMFGMREKFNYGECPNCGSIQIKEVPDNLEQFYPPYYVAYTQAIPVLKRKPVLKRLARNLRMRRKYKRQLDSTLAYIRPTGILPRSKILDIGCGKGNLICKLFNYGFENVTGVDKFITQPIDHGFGVTVLKKELAELSSNTYDLLIMHHVLEHVDGQIEELNQCNRLLKKGGWLLISIPVIGEAWDIYKENWVQLDAPRHFVLHTLKSMALLAEKTGFGISKTVFDSNAFQFWGSELYQKDIPLTLPDTHEWYPVKNGFSDNELQKFETEAKRLNAINRGDAASFYLYKK